jgi:uncharacterized phage protein (TIGR01671 family)
MREIKFRACLNEDKRFIDLNGFEIAFRGLSNQGSVTDVIEQGNLSMIKVDDVELLQYIGLKDKNGVEIYEGDILKRFHFECVDGFNHYIYHAIKWSEKYNGWIALNLNSMSESDGSPQLFVYAKGECEVIGNIHENPELLGE